MVSQGRVVVLTSLPVFEEAESVPVDPALADGSRAVPFEEVWSNTMQPGGT